MAAILSRPQCVNRLQRNFDTVNKQAGHKSMFVAVLENDLNHKGFPNHNMLLLLMLITLTTLLTAIISNANTRTTTTTIITTTTTNVITTYNAFHISVNSYWGEF